MDHISDSINNNSCFSASGYSKKKGPTIDALDGPFLFIASIRDSIIVAKANDPLFQCYIVIYKRGGDTFSLRLIVKRNKIRRILYSFILFW